MEIKNWYELTFEIETNLEEVIIGPETVDNSKPPIMVHSDKKKDIGIQV